MICGSKVAKRMFQQTFQLLLLLVIKVIHSLMNNSWGYFACDYYFTAFIVAAMLLFFGLILNVINIVLSYRLFKINETVSFCHMWRHYYAQLSLTFFFTESHSRFDKLDLRFKRIFNTFYNLFLHKTLLQWNRREILWTSHVVCIW